MIFVMVVTLFLALTPGEPAAAITGGAATTRHPRITSCSGSWNPSHKN